MMSRWTWLAAACVLLPVDRVWACATCFGAPDDPQTKGMNAAILTLLGITYSLFLVMIAAAFVIWRKTRVPSEADAAESASTAPAEAQHG